MFDPFIVIHVYSLGFLFKYIHTIRKKNDSLSRYTESGLSLGGKFIDLYKNIFQFYIIAIQFDLGFTCYYRNKLVNIKLEQFLLNLICKKYIYTNFHLKHIGLQCLCSQGC